jgi:endonuclease/exonuclease/phosphatase (EEP) superfamily protein YafD
MNPAGLYCSNDLSLIPPAISVIRTSLIVALAVLLLSGCVSVPDQARLIDSRGHTVAVTHTCNAKRPEAAVHTLRDSEISLVSWNIYKEQRPGWEQDLSALSHDADVLLLQEAYLKPGLRHWLQDQDLDWDMGPAFDYRGVPTGVITAGRGEAEVNCSMLRHEPYIYLPKAVLISYYPIRGRQEMLLVANIHGINFTLGPKSLGQQLEAAREIIQHHQGPVILAGDFNTWSVKRQQILEQVAAELGLQPVTFEGQMPAMHMGRVVDHIYFRGMTQRDSRVIAVKSSDHYPLKVRFVLN